MANRVVFAQCNYEKIQATVQATFPTDTSSTVNLDKQGCLPLFVVYRFGSAIGLIQGVDGPTVLNLVDINIPPLPDFM